MKTNPSDEDDDVLRMMRKHRIPLTRKNYLEIAFGGEGPKELSPEHEEMLPKMFRNDTESG